MPNRSACLTLAAVLVAGCAGSRMPETSFGEPEALQRAVMRYYEAHATEEHRKNDRDGLGEECMGYGERRFTLAKGADGVEVLDMSGPQHSAGSA